MSINIEINDKEIQYTNKELIKIGFDFQSSLTQTVIEFAQKEFNLNSSQLKILTTISSNIKTSAIGGALDWDTSKTLEENIAHVSGTIIQDLAIAAGTTAVVGAGLPAFATGVVVGAGLKYAGINLGDELQDLYSEYIDTTIKISNISAGNNISELENTFLVNELKKLDEIKLKLEDVEQQIKEYIEQNPREDNSNIKIELDKDNIIKIEKNTYNSSIVLETGQTISHIAVGTKYTVKEILQFNGLTEEDAKSLPVGYEVQIPKDVKNIEGGYGNVKLYEGTDGSLTYYMSNKNKRII